VCAGYLGVPEERLLLTNGLDEGLLAAAIGWLQRERHVIPEAVIVEPAFGMYADCAEATGGRIVTVPPRPSFEFPLEETLAALTPATRLVFVTTPGNPTGVLISRADVRTLARALPREALLFVDEAYAEFTDEHFLDELDAHPNVVVGRTFAKAQGLAGLRVGAVVGVPETVARLRRSLPPYSINVAAAVALVAALGDRAHLAWYRDQVTRTSCSCASARMPRPSSRRCAAGACGCAIDRRSRAAPAAFGSRPE
jgi:histidinol-phosphate aminotransferase